MEVTFFFLIQKSIAELLSILFDLNKIINDTCPRNAYLLNNHSNETLKVYEIFHLGVQKRPVVQQPHFFETQRH